MHWHHAKTVLGLRRHTEGTRRSDELNEAQQQRQQRQRRGHWLIENPRDRAEASEKPPFPWNPALRQPLQLSVMNTMFR